jgi:hypothetical protein
VSRRGNADAYLAVIASAAKQSILAFFLAARWIASRSLSSGARLRDPLARNDGIGCLKIEFERDLATLSTVVTRESG